MRTSRVKCVSIADLEKADLLHDYLIVFGLIAVEGFSTSATTGGTLQTMSNMFCPKCGAKDQSAESYCKHCGEWLPDVDAMVGSGLFRTRTREEKIRKMRVLEAVSAGLSLTAAAIIISVLAAGADPQLLFLAVFCCLFVAAYQVVNYYLGHKLQERIAQSRSNPTTGLKAGEERFAKLNPADTTPFVNRASVVENTTKNLATVRHKKKQ
jgi:hypothetical protein